jgi:hypothetical protein
VQLQEDPRRPTLAGPIQAAMGGVTVMIALMAMLVTATR